MKKIIALSLCVISLSAFSKTTVFSYHGTDTNSGLNYFYASSFNQNTNYCYVGLPSEVCLEVKAGAIIVGREYAEGAHDYFKVISCENNHGLVTVQSQLFDDYTVDSIFQKNDFGMCN